MKIYYTPSDNGDGSCSVWFVESQECVDKLEEREPESFRGEGGGSFEIPDGTEIKGIKIETMEDIDEYLEEMGL